MKTTNVWIVLDGNIAINKYQDRYLRVPDYIVWVASPVNGFPFDDYQTVSSDGPLGFVGQLTTRRLPEEFNALPVGKERSLKVRAFFASLEQEAETYIQRAFPLDFEPSMVPRCQKCQKELINGKHCKVEACPSGYCTTCVPASGYCPRHAFFTVEPANVNDKYWVLELGHNDQDGPGYYPWVKEDYIKTTHVPTFDTVQEAIDAFSQMSPDTIYLAPDVIQLIYNEIENARKTRTS